MHMTFWYSGGGLRESDQTPETQTAARPRKTKSSRAASRASPRGRDNTCVRGCVVFFLLCRCVQCES